MINFEDLKFEKWPDMGGIFCRIQFENGFGASIVKHEYSYGGRDGLYELAVTDKDGQLTYDTPITNDVLGYLSEDDVARYVNDIKDLKPNEA